MEQDDMCDTGLALGLNIYDNSVDDNRNSRGFDNKISSKLLERSSSNVVTTIEPSLTLGLSSDIERFDAAVVKVNGSKASCSSAAGFLGQPSPPHSTISSFTDDPHLYSVKTEKDAGLLTAEAIDEEDDEDGNARKKLRLTKEQSALLEHKFQEHSSLNPKQKHALAKQLKLRPRQVEVWFQNRRARTKLKQTQVNCELLKKCYETLKDENQRLQKELQELRAHKFSAGLYNRQSSPAVNMCPSCEKKTADTDNSKGSRGVTRKALFL